MFDVFVVECPAALLELKCLDRNVSIGGHPWHYMYVPLSDDPVLPPETETDSETFVVCDVATGQMVGCHGCLLKCLCRNEL